MSNAPAAKYRPLALRLLDLCLEITLCAALFFVLTSFAFLSSWEAHLFLEARLGWHLGLRSGVLAAASVILLVRYRIDPASCLEMEPLRSLAAFFQLPARISVTILWAGFFLTQWTMLAFMHQGLGTALWDFGFYDQILWNTSHGRPYITSILGGYHLLGNYFKPIIILVAQIYRVSSSQLALFAFSAGFAACFIPLIYRITRQIGGTHPLALALAVAAFFYEPLHNPILFPFHSQSLADPLLLLSFSLLYASRFWSGLLILFMAMICKDSVFFDVFGLGLFFIFLRRKSGWAVFGFAFILAVLTFTVIQPSFGAWNPETWDKWRFVPRDLDGLVKYLQFLLTPNPGLFLWLVLAPLLFLPLLSGAGVWLILPSLAMRLCHPYGGLRLITAHYTAGLNAVIFLAAAWAAVRFLKKRNLPGNGAGLPAALILASLFMAGVPQSFKLERWAWEASDGVNQRVVRILHQIPADYSVTSTETFLAHVTHREFLFGFGTAQSHAPLYDKSLRPDLLVVDESRLNGNEKIELDRFAGTGYQRIFEMEMRNGFYLRIYKGPATQVTHSLIQTWQKSAQSPESPWRKWMRKFWKKIVIIFSILLGLRIVQRQTGLFAALISRSGSSTAPGKD